MEEETSSVDLVAGLDILPPVDGMDNATGLDLRDLVESIYNEDKAIFSECLPESPPDSTNSINMMSPRSAGTAASSSSCMSPPTTSNDVFTPDLATVDYTVPMQLLEETRVKQELPDQVNVNVICELNDHVLDSASAKRAKRKRKETPRATTTTHSATVSKI